MAKGYKFPVPKFNFEVRFPSGVISFQEVTGLSQENEHLEYRTGASKVFVTDKRAGLTKTGTVSFKKGLIKSDTDLKDFYKKIVDKKDFFSKDDPPSITVTLKDEKNSKMFAWKITGVVPIKLDNADLKADDNSIAIEQMDIVHNGIEIL